MATGRSAGGTIGLLAGEVEGCIDLGPTDRPAAAGSAELSRRGSAAGVYSGTGFSVGESRKGRRGDALYGVVGGIAGAAGTLERAAGPGGGFADRGADAP